MIVTPETIPTVHPLMVRKIHFVDKDDRLNETFRVYGNKILFGECDIEEEGMADCRKDYDKEILDQSEWIFEITNWLMMKPEQFKNGVMIFTSSRWRNYYGTSRDGILRINTEEPLLFIGNPICILRNGNDLQVVGDPFYLIKSGLQMGF